MNSFVEKLQSAIVFRLDANDNTVFRLVKGSSIDLPDIDVQETRRSVESLISQRLSQSPLEMVLSEVKQSIRFVKSSYTQTHDGFQIAKGTGRNRNITVSDV
jgi:hypothetical protein